MSPARDLLYALPAWLAPYGREPLVRVAAQGARDRAQDATWQGTELAPIVFAANREKGNGPDPEWRQRQRKVRFGARLIAIAPQVAEPARVAASEVLGVPTVDLVGHRDRLVTAREVKTWAQAVIAVLGAMFAATGGSPFERLAAAGHIAGLWGRPYRVQAADRRLEPLFPRSRTPRGPVSQADPKLPREG